MPAINRSIFECLWEPHSIAIATDGAYKPSQNVSYSFFVIFAHPLPPFMAAHLEGGVVNFRALLAFLENALTLHSQ